MAVRNKGSFWLLILVFGLWLYFSSGISFGSEAHYPVIIAEVENLQDFVLFATSGWDGNWYVGYNHAWVTKLPPAPKGDYLRAYVGAKLGRAKNISRRQLERAKNQFERLRVLPEEQREMIAKQWGYGSFQEIKEKIEELKKRLSLPYAGKIFVGINSSPSWDEKHSFLLVSEEDIPLEGDPEEALEGVGEARWFWVEVPLDLVSFEKENYVAIWSPDENLVSAQVSPILASAWGSQEINTWFDENSKGKPPSSLSRSVTLFEPALALKLIPHNNRQVSVEILNLKSGEEVRQKRVVVASVSGEDIVKVWLEAAREEDWQKIGRFVYAPPYWITFDPEGIEEGSWKVRVGAEDFWGTIGYSSPVGIVIKR